MHPHLLLLAFIAAVAAASGAAAETQGARQRYALVGDSAAAAGHRGLVADGQGHAAGASRAGVTTASGGQGLRTRAFERSSDGSAAARGEASYSGPKVSAQRSGSATRSADGSASAERSGSITRAETGHTVSSSASYTQGDGVSRSVSCTDAAGQSIDCRR